MERLTRAKAIRSKCIDCCCGDRNEVKLCPVKDCPLWIYRLGREIASNGEDLPKKLKRANKIEGLNDLGV